MKCSRCGAPVDHGPVCFDCQRDELNREQAQFQIARAEEFYRTLFKDQLANQRKIAEDQSKDFDFREARRMLLDLELLAQGDLAAAKKKVTAFFVSEIFREHSGSLLDSIVISEFLLDCYCLHVLQRMSGQALSTEGIDETLDYYFDWGSPTLKKLYAKLVSLAEACDPTTTGLRPDLAEIIKTHPARREAKQKQEEQERRQKWEEFLGVYEDLCQRARSPVVRMVSTKGTFWHWMIQNFPMTVAQRQASYRRESTIKGLISWIEEGIREFYTANGRSYATKEMCIMALLWLESPFDRKLITLVMVKLLRQQSRDIKSVASVAVDEFERTEG